MRAYDRGFIAYSATVVFLELHGTKRRVVVIFDGEFHRRRIVAALKLAKQVHAVGGTRRENRRPVWSATEDHAKAICRRKNAIETLRELRRASQAKKSNREAQHALNDLLFGRLLAAGRPRIHMHFATG